MVRASSLSRSPAPQRESGRQESGCLAGDAQPFFNTFLFSAVTSLSSVDPDDDVMNVPRAAATALDPLGTARSWCLDKHKERNII